MKKVLIYGTGKTADYLVNHHSFRNETIVGVVETEKVSEMWGGYKVHSIGDVCKVEYDEIWLANCYIETLDACFENGILREKIVICNKRLCDLYCDRVGMLDLKYYKNDSEEYEQYVRAYELSRCNKILTTTLDRYHHVPYITINENGILQHDDYFRYAMIGLLAAEINQNKISGEVAELGVYKGRFSKCINWFFKERSLFLFDTFEGFSKNDTEIELSHGYTTNKYIDGKFEDTGVEEVLRIMPYPDKVVIRKGIFPDTVPEEEIKYAFVSLDCDMYKPTLEGLKYFYPRLSQGGYIMIHDYNHEDRWLGVREAVREYEKEVGHITKIPLADVAGSLIIG